MHMRMDAAKEKPLLGITRCVATCVGPAADVSTDLWLASQLCVTRDQTETYNWDDLFHLLGSITSYNAQARNSLLRDDTPDPPAPSPRSPYQPPPQLKCDRYTVFEDGVRRGVRCYLFSF